MGAALRLGGRGSDHLRGDTGNDDVRAGDGTNDTIDCGPGRDSALVDSFDEQRRCDSARRVKPRNRSKDGPTAA